ncbi:hypothetical protein PMKS-001306 [Pichia membranifaciens]|uniref:Uncharacterized protein n=1 Tax=Pichia membranifaciens TaxID=4926 RepID=A0A1Q2YEB0_9ASCO|nr:hypothetical protein PMKS-001306 [Pichia membranifaciens]
MIASTPMAKRIVNLDYLPTPSTGSSGKADPSFSLSTQSYIDKVRSSKYNTLDSVRKSLKDALLQERPSATQDNGFVQTPPSTPQRSPRKEIKQRIGLRSRLLDTLHRFQQGGLTDIEVKRYIREVTRMISKNKWIKEARYADEDAVIETGDGATEHDLALNSLGSFLDSTVEYVTMKDTAQVERWVRTIKRTSGTLGKNKARSSATSQPVESV